MKPFLITLPAALLWGTTALAAPITATSELDMFHRYTVNSGSAPTGLRIGILPGSLDIAAAASTSVDDPTATTTTVPFVQVANPFTDPPIPYIAQRVDRTTINAGTEGSQAEYDLNVLSVDDPDANPFDTTIVDRTVDTSGAATAEITTAPIGAAANSSNLLERGYTFLNESDETISFNIAGTVTASLLARYDGVDGFARASGNLFLEFEDMLGTDIDYLPIAPYLRNIEDADAGATVTENLVTSSGAFEGFNFAASATALGDGGDTEASFDATFRYLFRVEMDPGASFNLMTGHRQANAVEYVPQVAPVPLPASLPFLSAALLAFAALRRRARMKLDPGFAAS